MPDKAPYVKLKKIGAGVYRHSSGRYIISTHGAHSGPKGGELWLWELASEDPHGGLTIDGVLPYRTLREAKAALDNGASVP